MLWWPRRGCVTVQKNIVRIFISSTFNDFIEEREALNTKVFPNIKTFCESKGLSFQAVDLRWGISASAAQEQKTVDICLEEIERCQKISPKPNFVVLLGDRYGWQPLPVAIEKAEFESIVDFAYRFNEQSDDITDISKSILETAYKLDENAIPPVYTLQKLPSSKEREFQNIEERLLHLLRRSAMSIELTPTQQEKYFLSATGYEIIKGAINQLDQENGTEDQILCFFREIEEIESYADIDYEKLNRLKSIKGYLREKFKDNSYEYKVKIEKETSGQSYLDKFCSDVKLRIEKIVNDRIKMIANSMSEHKIEKLIQNEFYQERIRSFVGRDDIINEALDYIRNSTGRVLVIHGRRGVGKTSTTAKIVEKVFEKFSAHNFIVYRFVGITVQSCNAFSLLRSMCIEIGEYYKKDAPYMRSYNEAINGWHESLKLAHESAPLVIVIDAIDQLFCTDGADELDWLSETLPEYVSLIVITRDGEYVKRVANKLDKPIVKEILPLDISQAEQVLEQWLAEKSRTLTAQQYSEILDKFSENGLPLYLHFAFSQAVKWKSYESVHISLGINGIIKDYFDILSEDYNHGRLLLSYVLSYIAVSKNGLSESELIELLSNNDAVMKDYRRRSPNSPEVDTIPFICWSRLYSDIAPYIKEVYIDNAVLLQFYHLQVQDVVSEIYLAQDEEIELHRQLGKYFYNCRSHLREGEECPNLRKLSELPFHLMRSNEMEKLIVLLTDTSYLKAKVDAYRLDDLIDEFYWLHLNADKNEISIRLVESLLSFILKHNYEQHIRNSNRKYTENTPNISFEDIHSLLIYRKDTRLYDLFFQNGRDKTKVSNLCPSIDDVEYIEKINMDCLTKLLNYKRRIGNLVEAESILDEILQKVENDSSRILDCSRAYYDNGYIKYLQGKYDVALELMLKSAELSESGGNIVGKWISICVGYHIRMVSSLWTNHQCQYKDDFKNILHEALKIFRNNIDSNIAAKRWIMNVNAHLFNVAFLENDLESASKYFTEYANDPWVIKNDNRDIILPKQAKLKMLIGEFDVSCELFKTYIDNSIKKARLNNVSGIESFSEIYYWYGCCLQHASKKEEALRIFKEGLLLSDEPGNHKWKEKITMSM